jgi:hypothetical protein
MPQMPQPGQETTQPGQEQQPPGDRLGGLLAQLQQ